MNLSIISNYPQLLKRLTQHIGYLGDKCYQINNKQFSVTEKPKTLMIISRKHYQESWTTYSAVSLLELKKILRLQKAQNKESRCIQQYYSNNEADGFDVKTITKRIKKFQFSKSDVTAIFTFTRCCAWSEH